MSFEIDQRIQELMKFNVLVDRSAQRVGSISLSLWYEKTLWIMQVIVCTKHWWLWSYDSASGDFSQATNSPSGGKIGNMSICLRVCSCVYPCVHLSEGFRPLFGKVITQFTSHLVYTLICWIFGNYSLLGRIDLVLYLWWPKIKMAEIDGFRLSSRKLILWLHVWCGTGNLVALGQAIFWPGR